MQRRLEWKHMLLLALLLWLGACSGVPDSLPETTRLTVLSDSATDPVTLDGGTVSGEITIGLEREQGIRRVSFFLDAPERTEMPAVTDNDAPFLFKLDTTQLQDGPHMLTVVATKRRRSVRVIANSHFEVRNMADDPTPSPQPEPKPAPETNDFPVDLTGSTPEEKTLTMTVDKPANADTAILTLNVFDADQVAEGELFINNQGPVKLFGAQGKSTYNQQVKKVTFETDSGWWQDGENQLHFVHTRTAGFRVDSGTVAFSAAQPAPTPDPEPAPSTNAAPTVNAGNDQTVVLPDTASLQGAASDDGEPKDRLIYTWRKRSGPGTVTFSNPKQAATSVGFSEAGVYTLELNVSDTLLSAQDEIKIIVNAAQPAPAGYWQPRPGLSWFWQLSGTVDMTRNVDVYDIDYETPASTVQALHKQGKKVIAYVPVGDWEDYRPDSNDFPAEALCGSIDGWPERYIDIRHPKAVSLIKARIALAASKGFDAIEGDVVDLHLSNTGCNPRISDAEMTAYLKVLTDYAHSLGLAYFAKNVTENAAEWSTFTDGVVAEEAYQYGEAAGYMPYIKANKPVFAVEYGSSKPTPSQCQDANARGYALYGTNLNLTGTVYKTCW